MHISWDEYQRTPLYVRRVWWDCIIARRAAEASANDATQQYYERDQVRVRR